MQALYKSPGQQVLGNYPEGITFDCIVISGASEIEKHLADGWSMTPDDALAALNDEPQAAPSESGEPAPKRRGRPPKAKP